MIMLCLIVLGCGIAIPFLGSSSPIVNRSKLAWVLLVVHVIVCASVCLSQCQVDQLMAMWCAFASSLVLKGFAFSPCN
jgi:hypothetical protein